MTRSPAPWLQNCLTAFDRLRWNLSGLGRGSGVPEHPSPRMAPLEPRILFSATPIDPAVMEGQTPDDVMVMESDATDLASISSVVTDAQATESIREIVIIDSAVPELQRILDDLDGSADVFVLDSQRDGIEQISEILDGRSDIDSLHVISHGESGRIKLGDVWLSDTNLSGYAGEMAAWNSSLSSGADLLIYGCDLAGNSAGQNLIESIAALTGADVSASIDDTGHAEYEANWTLEYSTGEIESDVIVSQSFRDEVRIKLSTITVTTSVDVVDAGDGLVSLREAISQSSAGDRIELDPGVHALALVDDDDLGGDFDVYHDLTLVGIGGAASEISGAGIDRIFDIHGGTLSLENLKLTNGNAATDGGAVRVGSAAGLSAFEVVMTGNQAAGFGGAIDNAGVLSLDQVTLSQNTAISDGGAIDNRGTAILSSLTINDNESQANGGGIVNGLSASLLDLNNVTVSGNTAAGLGGGIHSRAELSLTHTTITENHASQGGGVSTLGANATLTATIISDNHATAFNDVRGDTFVSLGHNLIADSGGVAGFVASDILGHSALLAPLADNGGFVQTHALTSRSFAIDGAVDSVETLDARGETRFRDGDGDTIEEADIGAFELDRDTSRTIVVTNVSDVVDGDVSSVDDLKVDHGDDGGISLREAIEAVNATEGPGNTHEIHFDIDGSGVHRIELSSKLTVSREVILDASTQVGYQAGSPVIVVDASSAFLQDLLYIEANGVTVRGFSLVGAAQSAIELNHSDDSIIVGNVIGIDVSGVLSTGNTIGLTLKNSDDVQVGGTDMADRNVISGNFLYGINLENQSKRNIIQGNWIGPDLTGQSIERNGSSGIHIADEAENTIIGGTSAGAGNVIGGFTHGIRYNADALDGTVIQGNWIGTDKTETFDLGNTVGIRLSRGNITIGGGALSEGNTIAFSQNDAVSFNGTGADIYSAQIRGNKMFANGEIGIDLGGDGVTPNDFGTPHDADDGPNHLQNSPILLPSTVTNGDLSVLGEFRGSTDSGVVIDFYLSDSDNGQGKTYLGAITVDPDASGFAAFNATLAAVPATPGQYVVATATDPDGSTSEFSAGVLLAANNSAPTGISLSNDTLNEGIDTTAGVSVGILSTADLDAADTADYAIVGGADQTFFTIGGVNDDELILAAGVLDFETKDSFVVDVRVTDSGGGQHVETFTISVADRSRGLIIVDTTSDQNDTGRTDFDIAWLEANRGTDGKISLREAIIAANSTANEDGADQIHFEIAGGAQHILSLNEALPEITDTVILDGATDSTYVDQPVIVLRGNDLSASGLVLADGSDGSVIRGLVIRDFGLHGISISAGSDDHSIVANWVGGLDALTGDLLADQSNGGSGIHIAGSNNTIGGSPVDANVVSNNQVDGISVVGTAINNAIRFNQITDNGGLGIDLNGDGVTNNDNKDKDNDNDNGANGLQNNPELQSVDVDTSGDLSIDGQLKSLSSSTFTLDFYIATEGNTGAGEAARWLESFSVNTNSGGVANFSHAIVSPGLNAGQFVTATATDADGNTSEFSINEAIANANAPATGAPAIVGAAAEHETLSVDTSGIADTDGVGAFSYQWMRGGSVVGTLATYTLDDVDVGSTISVVVDFVDGRGFAESLTSASTASVAAANDPATGSPVIIGTATENETLSVDTSGIADIDGVGSFTYQWMRGGSVVGTSATYTLDDADVGLSMSVIVGFTDGQGFTESLTSASTANVAGVNDPATGSPTIVGAATENETLSVDTSGIADADGVGTFTYQWLRGGSAVGTSATYTLDDADVGAQMQMVVSFVDGQGFTEAVSSAVTQPVTNVNDAPTLQNRTRVVPHSDKVLVGTQLFQNASSDVDSSALTAQLVSPPEFGSLELNADGSFSYTPETSFFGSVAFQWQASDGALTSNVATVTIVIAPPINATPVAPPEPGDPGDGDSLREEETADELTTEPVVPVIVPSTVAPEGGGPPIGSSVVDVVLTGGDGGGEDGVFVLDFEVDSSLDRRELSATVASTNNGTIRIDVSDNLDRRIAIAAGEIPDLAIQYASLSESGQIWEQLDQRQREIDSLLASEKMLTGSVGVATGGFTVGIVAWALRGGFLLSGLLTQLPLWKSLDPMLIMQGVRGEDEDSLEEIMDKEQQALDDRNATATEAGE